MSLEPERVRLGVASQKADALRYLLRLAKDLKLLNKEGYAFVSERLEEGDGWQRSLSGRSAGLDQHKAEHSKARTEP